MDKLANHNQHETNKMPCFKPLSHYIIDNNKLEQYEKTWAHNPEVTGSNPVPATAGEAVTIIRDGFSFIRRRALRGRISDRGDDVL